MTLKMESVGYSETLVLNYQAARHNIPFYLQFMLGSGKVSLSEGLGFPLSVLFHQCFTESYLT
jgi:hypothetical protein